MKMLTEARQRIRVNISIFQTRSLQESQTSPQALIPSPETRIQANTSLSLHYLLPHSTVHYSRASAACPRRQGEKKQIKTTSENKHWPRRQPGIFK